MSKPKFKNNKRELTPQEEYNQLVKEFKVIHQLVDTVKLGESKAISSTLFSKYRAFLCTGSWTMNPLLLRVLKKLEIKLFFYTTSESNFEKEESEVFSQIFTSKQWAINKTNGFSVKITIEEYLQRKEYYNVVEDRFISRNDLIRIIADSEGSHFDSEINLYSEFLDNASVSFNGVNITQKELFMWDLYFLIEWIMNWIELVLFLDKKVLENGTNFEIEYNNLQDVINERNSKYDNILINKKMSRFTFAGYRVCDDCKSKLIKIEQTKYECSSCKKITEL